jgi:hypothetical protein
VNVEVIIPALIGGFIGVTGSLLVGLFLQRRAAAREMRRAARAVYFEMEINRMSIEVARDLGSYLPLVRTSFDRFLPDLATWLPVAELRTVVSAYLGHAGYAQAGSDPDLAKLQRRMILDAVLNAHVSAMSVLGARVFSAAETAAVEEAQAAAVKGT